MASHYYTRSQARIDGARNANVNNGDDDDCRGLQCYKEEEKSDNDNLCVICLDKWTSRGFHRSARLTCGHIFGYCCIKRWVMMNPVCPICKSMSSPHHLRGLYHMTLRIRKNAAPDAEEGRRRFMELRFVDDELRENADFVL
ncbi:hypothetical protein BsWGS_14183 [Bradybaena similaris]